MLRDESFNMTLAELILFRNGSAYLLLILFHLIFQLLVLLFLLWLLLLSFLLNT